MKRQTVRKRTSLRSFTSFACSITVQMSLKKQSDDLAKKGVEAKRAQEEKAKTVGAANIPSGAAKRRSARA